jgi:hypothetical protein
MAYMRSPYYVYTNGVEMSLFDTEGGTARIPIDVFDKLVIQRFAALVQDDHNRLVRLAEEVSEEEMGNFGNDWLREVLNKRTASERLRQVLQESE